MEIIDLDLHERESRLWIKANEGTITDCGIALRWRCLALSPTPCTTAVAGS